MIVYVTSQARDSCGSTLASAAACEFDPDSNRPVAGNIIFCKINPAQFASDLSTAVHELLHILVRAWPHTNFSCIVVHTFPRQAMGL